MEQRLDIYELWVWCRVLEVNFIKTLQRFEKDSIEEYGEEF